MHIGPSQSPSAEEAVRRELHHGMVSLWIAIAMPPQSTTVSLSIVHSWKEAYYDRVDGPRMYTWPSWIRSRSNDNSFVSSSYQFRCRQQMCRGTDGSVDGYTPVEDWDNKHRNVWGSQPARSNLYDSCCGVWPHEMVDRFAGRCRRSLVWL
jgi:hypothetical protein